MESSCRKVLLLVLYLTVITNLTLQGVRAWTGEIHGRVVCDVCGDSSVGPEDHVLEGSCFAILLPTFGSHSCCLEYALVCTQAGAEVAVLCITKSGEVLNYQAYTDSKGIYRVAETMPESDRWDACLARPISSFHEHCTRLGDSNSGVKFSYSHPSGYSHRVRPFVYRPTNVPTYCI
ncbi:hypothetical protein RND71_004601 [Anisodus tanguticus]|uniref:Uncharacterized protein n=1 Tax=Anisodus tanguticus TaxID=243964 RepID=A0AAE1SQA2_9SOLA|nr:hypothetical protein RND71_004601 [Anisodus tanguticus]